MVLALICLKGVASGNLLEAHIIKRRNLFQDLVFGKWPTQSIMTLLKGSLKAGIGCKGAWGIL